MNGETLLYDHSLKDEALFRDHIFFMQKSCFFYDCDLEFWIINIIFIKIEKLSHLEYISTDRKITYYMCGVLFGGKISKHIA